MKNDLLDSDLLKRPMNRRAFHRALASAGLAAVTVSLPMRAARAEEQAIYFTWSGYDDPALHKKYAAKYGALPGFSLFGDEEEAFQKVRAGFRPDVAHPCHGSILRWIDAGLITPIDTSRLSNWDGVFPKLKTLTEAQIDGKQWFVPFDWGNTSITYRTDLVDPKYEKDPTWGLLWDERYKGRLSVIDGVEDLVPVTAIYAGIKNPFDMSDEDLSKVKALLVKQKPLLRFYSADMTTMEQSLASGELVAAMTWNDAPVALKKQGLPVKFMHPKEGMLTWVCGLVLLKEAPHPDKAYDLIDSLLDPSAGKFLIEEDGYGHSNARSFELVSDEKLQELGLPRDPTALLENGFFLETLKNKEKIVRMFEDVKAGL